VPPGTRDAPAPRAISGEAGHAHQEESRTDGEDGTERRWSARRPSLRMSRHGPKPDHHLPVEERIEHADRHGEGRSRGDLLDDIFCRGGCPAQRDRRIEKKGNRAVRAYRSKETTERMEKPAPPGLCPRVDPVKRRPSPGQLVQAFGNSRIVPSIDAIGDQAGLRSPFQKETARKTMTRGDETGRRSRRRWCPVYPFSSFPSPSASHPFRPAGLSLFASAGFLKE